MTLQQVYTRLLKDEYPPSYLICIVNQEYRSIPVKELGVYDTMYKFLHRDNAEKIPVLTLK
jgi:hypothetical protein